MQYIKVTFFTISSQVREILIAKLDREGYEGFEETDEKLYAYIASADFDNETILLLAGDYNAPYETETLGEQNWNHEWEKSFTPVIVDDLCTIRADFHDIEVKTAYDIVITPKMTFGTGHHATTQLMIKQMRGIDFQGKSVLDFGTGTGILAIMAEKLGAAKVIAIDNDEWSYDNSKENIVKNNCSNIEIGRGSIETVEGIKFDIILANINRHILLQYMNEMYYMLKSNGKLLMSGLLKDDEPVIKEVAQKAGFELNVIDEMNNWICLLFTK